jgi:predicted phosphate transport protein (TIGR00153 family)
MLGRLIPREERFYDLFQDSARNGLEAAQALNQLMTDYRDVERRSLQMQALEHKGDEISHEIGSRLATTFVTPFERDDIHNLNSALDDVVDTIEKIVDTFLLYRIKQPTSAALQLSSIIVQQCEVIVGAMGKLKSMKDLRDDWVEIHRLESEGDRVSREAVASLFADSMDAIDVIKWKDVYELFESGCDRCEDVADIVEQIVAKHA